MTPTTRLPLVDRLRLLASPAAENWPDYVRINSMVSDGLEAAALIEKQGAKIEAFSSQLEQCVELLDIIKEHWIDYDHIYSIAVHESRELLAAKTLGERE